MLFLKLMLMGKTPESHSLSKPLLLLVAVIFPCLFFTCFQGFRLSLSLVSFPIMILSTLFLFKFTKNKPTTSDENHHQLSPQNSFHELKFKEEVETQKQAKSELDPISECFQENEIAQKGENGSESEELELEDSASESEASGSDTSEDFEPKWDMSSTKMGQNPPIYECPFFEDDDELIEISLPGSEPSPNLPGFLPESIFSHRSFMEVLTDMNEEENLIEIDISMGSIKCPMFEIKA